MSTRPMYTHQDMHWAPESQVGTWATSLTGLALAGTVALVIAFSAGLDSAETFTDNWLLSAAGVAISVCAVASAVTGLLALIRRHDHSWLVVAATGVGGLVSALMLQQVVEGLV